MRPWPMPYRRRSGFTLIELLVVIALIMMVATLLMPALLSGGAMARAARCMSNVGQVVKAIITYSVGHEGWLPSPPYSDTQPRDSVDDDKYYFGDRTEVSDSGEDYYWYKSHNWRGKILPYLGGRTVEVSDALKAKGGTFELKDTSDELYNVLRCTVVYSPPPYSSVGMQYYGMNGYVAMFTNPQRLRDPDADDGRIAAGHIDTIPDATNTLYIGENWDSHWAVKPKYPRNSGDFTKSGTIYAGEVIARHGTGRMENRKCNWAFFDGHAQGMTLTTLHENDCFLWLPEKPE